MQAEVLRQIAAQGSKGFYQSDITVDLVKSLQELGGVHTLADFEDVSVQYVEPIYADLKDGSTLIELPPNGQGITAIMMKKLMELCHIERFKADSFERVHLEAEIAKIAYSARNNFIGDPNFSKIKQSIFTDETYLKKLSGEICFGELLSDNLEDDFFMRNKDTVLICAADNEGNAISLIFSTFHAFGSGLCSRKYGLLFHNRGAGFTLKKNHANELLGGKRPLHTIIPAILKEKNGSIMPFGVMGGQYQANGHARILSNIKDYGMEFQEALNFPRSFYFDGVLNLERGYPKATREKLSQMGYKIEEATIPIGGAQLVRLDSSGVLIGASDPRKDGCALGY
jgi:gamma-glutamyltranspeptidase/glutathione hydrolase